MLTRKGANMINREYFSRFSPNWRIHKENMSFRYKFPDKKIEGQVLNIEYNYEIFHDLVFIRFWTVHSVNWFQLGIWQRIDRLYDMALK